MKIEDVKYIYEGFSKTYENDVKKLMNYTAYIRVPEMVMAHFDGRKPKILDLGCGTGLSSLLFFKRGYDVTGIDGTRDMIERASRLPYKKLICQNLEKNWRVPDKSFDAAVMIGVMEYIDSPAIVLAHAHKKLVDGGLFGLTFPYKSRWFADSSLKSYYRKEVEPVMAEAGFDIIKYERIIGVEEEGERAYYMLYLLRKAAGA